ncbi:hypothetical protein C4J81_06995 [Deltaproteobacteria bacterium Smac51]|nr:hypothetical protein C4J81_06995 [Deltaproteobacteria bacterium Smac51]
MSLSQVICLARALALEPVILLLDEPTASLDVKSAATVEECLKRLSEKYSVIMVSYSLAQAWRMADHLHYFHEGRYRGAITREGAKTEEDLIAYLESGEITGERI